MSFKDNSGISDILHCVEIWVYTSILIAISHRFTKQYHNKASKEYLFIILILNLVVIAALLVARKKDNMLF